MSMGVWSLGDGWTLSHRATMKRCLQLCLHRLPEIDATLFFLSWAARATSGLIVCFLSLPCAPNGGRDCYTAHLHLQGRPPTSSPLRFRKTKTPAFLLFLSLLLAPFPLLNLPLLQSNSLHPLCSLWLVLLESSLALACYSPRHKPLSAPLWQNTRHSPLTLDLLKLPQISLLGGLRSGMESESSCITFRRMRDSNG